MTMAPMTRRPASATPGLLDTARAHWARQGWDPKLLDLFRMGPEPTPPPAPPAPPAPPPAPPAPAPSPPAPTGPDLAALQAQIDAAKAAGGSEALKPFMAIVGAATEEELTAKLNEWKQGDEQRKSAETRALEAQQKAERDAATAAAGKSESDLALLNTHALMRAGVTDPDQIQILLPLIKIEGDPTPETATAAVEKVKTTFPALFTAAGPTPPGPTPPHSVPPIPPPPGPGGDPLAKGRERAKAAKAAAPGATREDLLSTFGNKQQSPLAPAS